MYDTQLNNSINYMLLYKIPACCKNDQLISKLSTLTHVKDKLQGIFFFFLFSLKIS